MIVRLRSLKFDSPACDKNEHYSLNTNDNIFLYRIGHQQVDFGGFLRFRRWIWLRPWNALSLLSGANAAREGGVYRASPHTVSSKDVANSKEF